VYENPSAGKFELPHLARETAPAGRRHSPWLVRAARLMILYAVVRHVVPTAGHGWLRLLAGIGIVMDYIVYRMYTEATDDDDPYTQPTSITR
jgi:hypothetical protein